MNKFHWINSILKYHALIIVICFFFVGCNKVVYPKNAPIISSDFHSDTHVDGQRRQRLHQGIDILAKHAEKVIAVADGIALKVGAEKCWGPTIIIDHGKAIDGENIVAIYSHLNEILIKTGENIRRGQLIGTFDTKKYNYECLIDIEPHFHFQIGRSFSPSYQQSKNWGWRYKVYDIDRGVNPHMYWADGVNKITCFDNRKKYRPGTITYPVPC